MYLNIQEVIPERDAAAEKDGEDENQWTFLVMAERWRHLIICTS